MITVGWGDHEETFVVFRAQFPWSVDEQFQKLHICYTLVREKNYIVDMMVDLRHISVPSTYDLLFYRLLANSRPENLGAIIHVTNLSFARKLKEIWNSISAHHSLDLYLVNDVDSAYTMLEVARRRSCVSL